jgi:hypothetical protein
MWQETGGSFQERRIMADVERLGLSLMGTRDFLWPRLAEATR